MSYADEFKSQWGSLVRKLDSDLILAYKRDGMVNFESISKLLENEKARWTFNGEYNCAWLNKLRGAKPDVANRFLSVLNGVHFTQPPAVNGGNPLVILGPAAAGAALGFALMRLVLHQGTLLTSLGAFRSTVLTLLGTVVLAGAGGSLGYSAIYKRKQASARQSVRSAYLQQLKQAGESLTKIVEEADK